MVGMGGQPIGGAATPCPARNVEWHRAGRRCRERRPKGRAGAQSPGRRTASKRARATARGFQQGIVRGRRARPGDRKRQSMPVLLASCRCAAIDRRAGRRHRPASPQAPGPRTGARRRRPDKLQAGRCRNLASTHVRSGRNLARRSAERRSARAVRTPVRARPARSQPGEDGRPSRSPGRQLRQLESASGASQICRTTWPRRQAGGRRRRATGACLPGEPMDRPESNPARWPIGSGPTLTSPSAATVTGSASAPRAPMSRTSTAVRRSTKRWVSRSCNASERRASTARVRSAHLDGSASQSARCAI